MSQNLNNNNNPIKVLWFGDLVQPSGFGRIGNEVTTRLAQRGWAMLGASIPWSGYPPSPLPYFVWGMGGQDIWNRTAALALQNQPDIIVCCQDFPYAQTLFHGTRIDWSTTKFIIVTPIDGLPVHPDWLDMVDMADATLTISAFGVEGLRLAGKQVDLLPPGVDTNEFYPAEDGEVAALRETMGIAPDAFVMGMFAMNQGRKAVSATITAFKEFALDKPEALLYLDMDKTSPAGWDIPALLRQIGLDEERVVYREDAQKAEIVGLRERYLLVDVNSVVSHREGFGLPLIESQACKIVSMALDWCSGSEIVGGGRGMLVRRIDYMEHGTWGGARDAFPDMKDWVGKLNTLYHQPDKRAAIAAKGYEYATTRTWDKATDAFESVLKRVAEQHKKERRAYEPDHKPTSVNIPAPGLNDTDGPARHNGGGAGVQQPTGGVPVPGIAGGQHQPGDHGDIGAGRRQPGLQPAGDALPAGDSDRAE